MLFYSAKNLNKKEGNNTLFPFNKKEGNNALFPFHLDRLCRALFCTDAAAFAIIVVYVKIAVYAAFGAEQDAVPALLARRLIDDRLEGPPCAGLSRSAMHGLRCRRNGHIVEETMA
jgi:hypothetical protein